MKATSQARKIIDEAIMATENYFGATSPKRAGHIHIYAEQIDHMHADLIRKAREMRNAIDMIEGALMGFGDLVDLPDRWGEPRHRSDVGIKLPVTAGQVYRVCDALAECTRIINDEDYVIPAASQDLANNRTSGGENGL